MAQKPCDPSPTTGRVYLLPPLTDSAPDIRHCGLYRRNPETCAGILKHVGGNKTRFYGQDMHAISGQAIPKRFEIGVERSFRCVVGRRAASSALAADRADAYDLPAALRLKIGGRLIEPCHRAENVGLHDLHIFRKIKLVFSCGD